MATTNAGALTRAALALLGTAFALPWALLTRHLPPEELEYLWV